MLFQDFRLLHGLRKYWRKCFISAPVFQEENADGRSGIIEPAAMLPGRE